MTTQAKQGEIIEEIRANTHCGKTLSRLSIGYRKMSDEFPSHRVEYTAEAFRLRQSANWYLSRARRLKAQAS
jgi:hypothetical protein